MLRAHRFSRTYFLLPALLLAASLSGCLPESSGDPSSSEPCAAEGNAEIFLGEFGGDVSILDPGAALPTWVPLQGGVVVGLNLVATGVPRDSNPASITILDAETQQTLGELQSDAAFFKCREDLDLRIWDRIMIPLETGSTFDAQVFDEREVEVHVSAGFPNLDGDDAIFLRDSFHMMLENRAPDRDVF